MSLANSPTAQSQIGRDVGSTPNVNYKEQLDTAAKKVKYPEANAGNEGVVSQVVEKVTQYVPAVGKVLGHEEKHDDSSRDEAKIPGPPHRPHHDVQIEDFLRDQHRSKPDAGTLAEE